MVSRVGYDVWGWQCLIQIQAGTEVVMLMIQMGVSFQRPGWIAYCNISGREEVEWSYRCEWWVQQGVNKKRWVGGRVT